MKKHGFIICSVMAILALASCNKENVQYYSVLGTIKKTTDSTIIESDDGPRMMIEDRSTLGNSINDGDRVFAYFSLIEKPNPKGIDYIIDIYSIEKLLFKQIIEITDEIADSIGNDEMSVQNLWIARDYLNLNFKFYSNDKNHYINLIRYPGDLPTDTVKLEIRHNSNGDNGNYQATGFVSFDLKTLKNEVADSVVLQVSAKEYDNRTFKRFITYKY